MKKNARIINSIQIEQWCKIEENMIWEIKIGAQNRNMSWEHFFILFEGWVFCWGELQQFFLKKKT